ncbi:MAG: lycopene cyclase [Cyclobacteriaceae bacterium]|nr:lycopene cyclase [Cyclobacteriaceae bacterium]
MNTDFDIIIAGAGLSGLSLAARLSENQKLKILLLDPDDKKKNDRTWCFWESKPGFYEDIVIKKWDKVIFRADGYESFMNILPYKYKMVRGLDFYNYNKKILEANQNLHWVNEKVTKIEESENQAIVYTNGSRYTSNMVFSSIPKMLKDGIPKSHHFMLQHFKGWEIRTSAPAFDPEKPVFMDFETDQKGQTRFFYVLPYDDKNALIEYTIFSPAVLEDEVYDIHLKEYIQRHLGNQPYEIKHIEKGAIPMTDLPIPSKDGKRIFNLGTSAGLTKPSTGYTFARVQEFSDALSRDIHKNGFPSKSVLQHVNHRFLLYDSTLLHVLQNNTHPADKVFRCLFEKNPPARILKFLEEKTTLMEDIPVMWSVPVLTFMQAMGWVIFRKRPPSDIWKTAN